MDISGPRRSLPDARIVEDVDARYRLNRCETWIADRSAFRRMSWEASLLGSPVHCLP